MHRVGEIGDDLAGLGAIAIERGKLGECCAGIALQHRLHQIEDAGAVGEAEKPAHAAWLSNIRQAAQFSRTSYVHGRAVVIGRVVTGEHVHIAAGASVRADEGSPFFLGSNTNVQDGVVIHALKDRRVLVGGEEWAVYVGKTNLDQFATGLNGTRTPHTIPRSVYGREMISGGSSSGSALAVALGQVPFAVATDTAGSGRVPAALNGIVGFKPSRGLISTVGLVPACKSLDCLSVMAGSIDDVDRVLDVMVARDDDVARRHRADRRPEADGEVVALVAAVAVHERAVARELPVVGGRAVVEELAAVLGQVDHVVRTAQLVGEVDSGREGARARLRVADDD